MALSRKIRDRVEYLVAERRDRLPEAAEQFRQTLIDALGVQGSKDDRSAPGEAPRRQDGTLQGSVGPPVVDEQAGRATIGPKAIHGQYLLKTRPYYRITIDRCRARLREILLGR